jgi:hypothetical protein
VTVAVRRWLVWNVTAASLRAVSISFRVRNTDEGAEIQECLIFASRTRRDWSNRCGEKTLDACDLQLGDLER